MKQSIILLIGLFLIACEQKTDILEEIRAMQKSEDLGSPEHSARLAELHMQYGLEHADSLGNSYLYAAGVYYYYENQHTLSDSLLGILLDRPVEEVRWRNAQVLKGLMQAEKGDYEAMDDHLKLAIKIGGLTTSQWNDVIQAYQQKHKEQDATAQELYYIASGLRQMGKFQESLDLMDQAMALEDAGSLRANMLYEAGFLCWDVLKDQDKAKAYYQQFITDYPEHPQAEEVRQLLENGMLEMSDQEILEMLKAKAAADPANS